MIKRSHHYFRRGGYLAGFVAVGVILTLLARAATPFVSIEPEQGVVAGSAVVIGSDAGASGGSVQFKRQVAGNGLSSSYTVSGNKILDAAGQQVLVHGVARPSMEWQCDGQMVGSAAGGIPSSDFVTMKTKWNANAVRIALNQDFWLSGAARYCSSYAANIDAVVRAAQQNGLIVILDLHWSDMGNLAYTGGSQQCMADVNSITFWQQVATTYKNNPAVWFELYNEPHNLDWNTWRNGGTVCGFQAVGMQQLYNTVRSTGANNIVIAGGYEWASHLDGVPLLTGTNIAYAIHPYAADVSGVNGGNPNTWSTSDWDTRFGNIAAQVPVLATEFGDVHCGSTYIQGIMDYFRARQIGFTAWAWYAGGCGFPSLITNAAGDCVATMGCVIQTEMRKY